MGNDLNGAAVADTELHRASVELHELGNQLEELRGLIGQFTERALGAPPPIAGTRDERVDIAQPAFNNGLTGDVRRGIYSAYTAATELVGMARRLSQIV